MSMSIASLLDANMAPLSVYTLQINLLAISLATISETDALRRYMPDEPGGLDPNKNKPAQHMRKIQKVQRIPKHELPRENNTVVVGMIGTNAVLKCHVGLKNVTVVWVKHNIKGNISTVTILTANDTILTDDKRFLAVKDDDSRIWEMHIRYTKPEDAGRYECQVCNEPSFSIYVQLDLLEARAVILGPSIREVDKGFPIRLSCILNSTNHYRIKQRATYMFWYHDNRMINYDLKDGAVVREGRLATELIFRRALPEHAGNYSCVPSNARQASVQVIVHYKGETLPSPLSIYSSNDSTVTEWSFLSMALLLIAAVCVNS